jgi:hypothetical protein
MHVNAVTANIFLDFIFYLPNSKDPIILWSKYVFTVLAIRQLSGLKSENFAENIASNQLSTCCFCRQYTVYNIYFYHTLPSRRLSPHLAHTA